MKPKLALKLVPRSGLVFGRNYAFRPRKSGPSLRPAVHHPRGKALHKVAPRPSRETTTNFSCRFPIVETSPPPGGGNMMVENLLRDFQVQKTLIVITHVEMSWDGDGWSELKYWCNSLKRTLKTKTSEQLRFRIMYLFSDRIFQVFYEK